MPTPPTFTAYTPLTAAQLNQAGLWLVKSQTVGTGVASVAVTGAFSADYDNYRIVWSGGTSSTNDSAYQIQFANTAHHYAVIRYDSYLGAATSVLPTNAQTAAYFGISGQAKQDTMVLDVMNPYQAIFTKWTGLCTGNAYYGTGGGVYAQNTSITSFTIIAPFGTMTGGTIRVYGYRN
jgi:hypothetical protein